MPKSVFISYSHRQGEWVWDRLVPCLKAGGAEVLIDRERFDVGRAVVGQMDATQDTADVHVLVLSPEYLASGPCVHEMEHAMATDPRFEHGTVVPVLRADCPLPDAIRDPNPLYADLRDDGAAEPWDRLLRACGRDLGVTAPAWLAARDDTRRFLERGQSVNLATGPGVAWRPLIEDLRRELPSLASVDLEKPAVYSRRGLVTEILRVLGTPAPVPAEPGDLAVLERTLEARGGPCLLALTHFDSAARYDVDFFRALRYLVMESRRLVLLAHSRGPFMEFLPTDHPLSELVIQAVELPARR